MPFIKIPPRVLHDIATSSERIPTLYYSRYWLVGEFFWMRLWCVWQLVLKKRSASNSCLDFGGGGVFLPTLSIDFQKVVCVDLETKESLAIVNQYELKNVEIIKADACQIEYGKKFDVVVAADVLEHFIDLVPPVSAIKKALAPHGILVTSLPTENWLYMLLRLPFGIKKPADHYHNAAQVEAYLKKRGFIPTGRLYVPFLVRLFPLFRITVWKLKPANL